jgi:hypothetical protein
MIQHLGKISAGQFFVVAQLAAPVRPQDDPVQSILQ